MTAARDSAARLAAIADTAPDPTGARGLAAHPVLAPGILAGFHLLEADAGTGKTWTLSGLVVRALVERRLGIEQVLVVTFTNAATAELAARIRERIAQLARLLEDRIAGRDSEVDDPFCVEFAANLGEPEAALALLRVALSRIDEASVRTIHSFCKRVIDEHALSIGVAAGLEAEALGDGWLEQGLVDWWRAEIQDAPMPLLRLLRDSKLSPAGLLASIRAIEKRPAARLLPAPSDWRNLSAELAAAKDRLRDALARDAQPLRDWLGVKANRGGGSRYRADHVANWLDQLGDWVDGAAARPPECLQRFTTAVFAGPTGALPVPELGIVGECDRIAALEQTLATLPAQLAIDAWQAIARRRTELQAAAGAIDHDQLLRIVHDALHSDEGGEVLAASLRERYPLALIDECQDTDALQWRIFRRIYLDGAEALAGGAGLVLVGDPKQAIYAFRAADVYSYLAARDAGPRRHSLDENQRSVRPLIEAVNALFDRDDAFMVPEIGFRPTREGVRRRRAFEVPDALRRAPLTVALFDPPPPGEMLATAVAGGAATTAVAAEAARLLGSREVRLDGRPLVARDIAVLVASHKQGSAIKRALAKVGIGAIEISRASVFESEECDELIRLVAAVADPADPGLVRSALVTAMLGRDAAALGAPDGADQLDAIERFSQARRDWASLGPLAAMRRLIDALGIGVRLAALSDGDRRLTNLMHLLELLASSAEARDGAHAGLRWLGRMRADPGLAGSEAGELRLESDEDLVRIVTVHKSKGLEFPIVFLPFAWDGREETGKPPLSYHERGEAVFDLAPTGDAAAGALAARRERYAETVRTLYVALTRAEQRCYLFWGAVRKAQFSPLAWLLNGLDPLTQKDWKQKSKDLPALDQARVETGVREWAQRVAARCDTTIEVTTARELFEGAAPSSSPDAVAPDDPRRSGADRDLEARRFDGWVPPPWIRASFSGLIAAAVGDADDPGSPPGSAHGVRPDHDQSVVTRDSPAAPAEAIVTSAPGGQAELDFGAPDVRFTFPAGAQAGVCLHDILERTRFDQGVDLAVVRSGLLRAGYDAVDPAAVRDWLDAVIAAPLPDPGGATIQLGALAPDRLVRELEFTLSARDVDDQAVFEAVGRHCPFDSQALPRHWTGFLKGFIDLVYEAGGRWYLLDWKSNRLAGDAQGYGPAALEASIREHGYALQYSLYALALHRLLRARLPGYDYERHFGGVQYVYLRGAGLGEGDGVYATRPPAALIEHLDRAFGGKP